MHGLPVHFQQLGADLNRAIFSRESGAAARHYKTLLDVAPQARLPAAQQFDLARLLELGGELELGLVAFDSLLEMEDSDPFRADALRHAGHLCFRMKKYELCADYLTQFLDTDPKPKERMDAEDILGRMPAGVKRPKPGARRPAPLRASEFAGLASSDHIEPQAAARGDEPLRLSGLEQPPREPQSRSAEALPKSSRSGMDPFAAPAPPPARRPAAEPPSKGSLGDARFESRTPPVPGSLRRAQDDARDRMARVLPPAEPVIGGDESTRRPPASIPASGGMVDDLQQDPEMVRSDYLRLRGATFALILPIGKRIYIDAVADLIARYKKIDEAESKKLSIAQKGIVFDNLSLADALELAPYTATCRQALQFVHVERALRPYERADVLGAEALEPGIRMTTEKGIKKARWADFRLISCATLDMHGVVDVFAGAPLKHFRFADGVFNFRTMLEPEQIERPRRPVTELVGKLVDLAPQAVRSHTVDHLRTGRSSKPQSFANSDEFDAYNRWLVFAHFAEPVSPSQLSAIREEASNW
ncbi:MAG: hypothetical protein SF028_02920 [Candidatus Sumerlaeia bacterium]|nr:hypothetical protein [Candidatus Sumerlaeia bacterium]